MFSEFSWWHVVYLLVVTHITIITVTVYLHRGLAHRSLEVKKPLEHFFRFWCWLTTGQNPKEWAAVHRKHHAFCEKPGDPHSPKIEGIWTVLFKGVLLYKKEANNPETIKKYGHFTPNDKMQDFYSKYSFTGLISLLFFTIVMFGWHTLWMYPIQVLWIPFWAAGVINGLGHFTGYKNFKPNDDSRNLIPWGIIIGGEELHNNHHAYPTSAKLSVKWYEFDIGWMWINLFKFVNLLKINKTFELPEKSTNVSIEQSLQAILSHKSLIMNDFYKKTKDEVKKILNEFVKNNNRKWTVKYLKNIFYKDVELSTNEKEILEKLLQNKILHAIYQARLSLLNLWNNKTATMNQLKEEWKLWVESFKHKSDSLNIIVNDFSNLKLNVK